MGVIQNLAVPLPSLAEQQAIADFLDQETARLDILVASKKQKLIERLKEKRTALISRTVTRGLNPNAKLKYSGIAWLGDIPAHWEVLEVLARSSLQSPKVRSIQRKSRMPRCCVIGPEHVESGTGRLLQRATAGDQVAESGKYFMSAVSDACSAKIRPALRQRWSLLLMIAFAVPTCIRYRACSSCNQGGLSLGSSCLRNSRVHPRFGTYRQTPANRPQEQLRHPECQLRRNCRHRDWAATAPRTSSHCRISRP